MSFNTTFSSRSTKRIVAGILLSLSSIFPASQAANGHWVTAWGCGPQLTESRNLPPVYLSRNTLRQYFHTTQEGHLLRVRFSNAYGTEPVPIQAAHIALAAGNGSAGSGEIDPSTDTPLTFNGAPSAVIPPGQTMYSDPVALTLPADADAAVSIYYGTVSETVINGHPGARANSFILTGNAVDQADMTGAATTRHWYNVTGIEVLADMESGTVVTFGDSITDGYGTYDGNHRWPDVFARRLSTNAPTAKVSVANMGIGGNAIYGGLGPAGENRFERDVLQQNGVRWLILFIGVNDIGGVSDSYAPTLAQNMIASYIDFANRAHAQNILVYGATITPFGDSGYYSTAHETARQTINAWIRTNEVYDAVIDLDIALRNPADTDNLLPAFNNDNLHPNSTGYEALAEAIDLSLFTTP